MREIKDKLSELRAAYQGQLNLYRIIGEVGSQERELIHKSQLDGLLQALREKEDLLKEAGEFEQQIRCIQDQLVRHFDLASFSLPQLQLVAPEFYHEELEALQNVVLELVPVLDGLEKQERQNEATLNQYLALSQGSESKGQQAKRAGRAYGKK